MALEVLSGSERLFGKESRGSTNGYMALGNIYREMEKLEQAENILETWHKICDKKGGPTLTERIQYQDVLGRLRLAQGRLQEAETILINVLQETVSEFGSLHSYTAEVSFDLGQLYAAKRDFIRAEAIYLRCIDVYGQTIRKDGPHVGRIKLKLGRVYLREGKPKKAIDALRSGLLAVEREFDRNCLLIADGLEDLAEALRQQGEEAMAEPYRAARRPSASGTARRRRPGRRRRREAGSATVLLFNTDFGGRRSPPRNRILREPAAPSKALRSCNGIVAAPAGRAASAPGDYGRRTPTGYGNGRFPPCRRTP